MSIASAPAPANEPAPLFVSIVIPAYNEAARLPALLQDLASTASRVEGLPAVDFIVSDDGSRPEDAQVYVQAVEQANEAVRASGAPLRFRVARTEVNGGKGAAIRRGWAHADPRCAWLGFLDADGAISASECYRLVKLLRHGDFDVLAGSRVKMAGRRVDRSGFRHLQGRVFATMVTWSLGLQCYDTQCGVKFFRHAVLGPHLGLLAENRWLLDIELLALMQHLRAHIREESIDWVDQAGSKVRFGSDAVKMALGLRRIKRHLARAGL